MPIESNPKVFECLMQLNDCTRYQAHARIDDSFAGFSRHENRTWQPSVVEVAERRFAAGVRTTDAATMKSLPQATWREMIPPLLGVSVTCRMEVAPKKPRTFTAFRDSVFATSYLLNRLNESGALKNISIEYLSLSMIDIGKKSCIYAAPAAWFEVTGHVINSAHFMRLITHGVGGSKSFGLGRLTPHTSAFSPAVQMASERQVAFRSCTA